MPSDKMVSTVRIARSLPTAEVALNQATIAVLTVGTEVLRARADGGYGVLEGAEAVARLGQLTTQMFNSLEQIAGIHASLRATAAEHDMLGYGDFCPPPSASSEAPSLLHIAA